VEEINNKEGKFVWKDTSVFVIDLQGTIVARAFQQQATGKNWMKWQDKSDPPKQSVQMMVDVAKEKGEGWVAYMYPRPGEDTPSKKISYVSRVPGYNLLVGAGIYE
jgi:signal transduction histidine kinase